MCYDPREATDYGRELQQPPIDGKRIKIYVVVHHDSCDDVFEGIKQECEDWVSEQEDHYNYAIQSK